ncbi:MAG TPA: hypothetical protein VJ963_03085 [Bacteroidales bacterium]|nr:hypothetical protein [Bacteroidales bacterium]
MKILKIARFARRYFPAFRDDNTNIVQGFTGKKLSVLKSGDINFREFATRLTLPVLFQVRAEGNNRLALDH